VSEEQIEALLDADPTRRRRDRPRRCRERQLPRAHRRALRLRPDGLKIGVDCANGAYSEIAPRAFEQLGAEVTRSARADGTNINVAAARRTCARLQQTVTSIGSTSASRSTATATGCSPSTKRRAGRRRSDPRDPRAPPRRRPRRRDRDVEPRLHRLLESDGIRVVTTPVGDRYVLEALARDGGLLGGEQSGHIIYLRDHVTGTGSRGAASVRRDPRTDAREAPP
jgi:phosphoglucosamine mutase